MISLVEYLLGPNPTWRDALLAGLDIGIVGWLIYKVLVLIRGTRALQMLVGIVSLGAGYLVAGATGLVTLHWLLGHLLSYGLLFGFIVIFQSDIRRALAQLGRSSLLEPFTRLRAAQVEVVDAVVNAAVALARRRAGALIVLERAGDLAEIVEGGVRIDAKPTSELIQSLFFPGSPTHDGAIILRGGRIAAARCVLPLAGSAAVGELGTRHRAALGLAEEIDAAVVVVSEERGEISLAVAGNLRRGLDEERLRRLLVQLTAPAKRLEPSRRLLRAVRGFVPAAERPTPDAIARAFPLAALSVITALSLFLGVRGDRVVAYRVKVPVVNHLASDLHASGGLPRSVELSLIGPWQRIRGLGGGTLGPLPLELSAERPGPASWYIRMDSLRLPPGIRVEANQATTGAVELVEDTPLTGSAH